MYGPVPATAGTPMTRRDYNKLWAIINGDNLDIIEEAAEKKGLV